MSPKILSGLTGRSYRFAFVFSVLPEMTRNDNLDFYDKLTAQGVELPALEQKKNEIVLQKIGNGRPVNVFRVIVGHFQGKFRLFVMEDFPVGSIELFNKTADAAWKVFSETWKVSGEVLQLTEVTVRYTAPVGADSKDFLLKNCLKIPTECLSALERNLNGVGIRLISPVIVGGGEKTPLPGADFNAHIESLLEDPGRLFIQVTSKWLSVPLPTARYSESTAKGVPTYLNPECQKPSWYVRQVESFVRDQIDKFLTLAGSTDRR